MHPLLQDFLAVVMDTMTMHINPQYKHITMLYRSARLSCCLQKSIAKLLSRKYSASNGLAAKGLHFSHPHRELSIERDLTISLSYLLVWLYMLETMIVILVRRTRSPSPLTNYMYICIYYTMTYMYIHQVSYTVCINTYICIYNYNYCF